MSMSCEMFVMNRCRRQISLPDLAEKITDSHNMGALSLSSTVYPCKIIPQ